MAGVGPPVGSGRTPTTFAQLRTQSFVDTLRADGHDVVALYIEEGGPPGTAEDIVLSGPVDGLANEARTRLSAARPHWTADVVVTAGPHLPPMLGVDLAGDTTPLWVDLPGCPFAEHAIRQAVDPLPSEAEARLHSLVVPALRRADAFSCISHRQSDALLGQLGLLGRLAHPPPIAVVPVLDHLPWDLQPIVPTPAASPVRVLLLGVVNAWADIDTLTAGLDEARRRQPIEVEVTGGFLAGHTPAPWDTFVRWAHDRPWVRLHGWVDEAALPAISARCHVVATLDRDCAEARLGSRTRVLAATRLGLPVIGTATCEMMHQLTHTGGMRAVPPRAPLALAAALLAVDPTTVSHARRFFAETAAPTTALAPLRAFVAQPRRVPTGISPLDVAQAESRALRAELFAMHNSPTIRSLSRVHRWVKRLLPSA